MIKPNVIATPSGLTFTLPNGSVRSVGSDFFNFVQVKEIAKALLMALKQGMAKEVETLYSSLVKASDLKEAMANSVTDGTTEVGGVEVKNGRIYVDGKLIDNLITQRILWAISEGYDATPQIKFMQKAYKNPLQSGIDGLWKFVEHNKMAVTPDGNLLAYKVVTSDYRDVHTHAISNKLGDTPWMARESVDPNPNNTCSRGLHVCAFDYINQFGGDIVIMVEINPADVVAVPTDYRNTKMRVCRYTVIEDMGPRHGVTNILQSTSTYGKDIKRRPEPEIPQEVAVLVKAKEPVVREKIEAPTKPKAGPIRSRKKVVEVPQPVEAPKRSRKKTVEAPQPVEAPKRNRKKVAKTPKTVEAPKRSRKKVAKTPKTVEAPKRSRKKVVEVPQP